MSRETDSSSSGPEGRGGNAYPSGTPPYGPPQYPTQDAASNDGSGAADASATDPANPRTETQLTTRISINIPGSRPIPPVVVRKPVEESGDKTARDDEGASALSPSASSSAASSGVPQQRTESAAGQESPAQDPGRTSSWFAPRRSPAPPPSDAGSGAGASGAAASGASAPAAPSESSKPGGAGGPSGAGGASGAGTPRSGLPYFSGAPGGPSSPTADRNDHQRDGAADSEPSGPTTGPASGDGPGMMPGESLLPPAFQRGFNSRPAAEKSPQAEPHPAEAEDGEGSARPRHARPNPLEERPPGGPDARRPGGLGESRPPAYGAGASSGLGAGASTGLGADDLAGPPLGSEPAVEPPGPHVSGDTLVSGVPVVGSSARRSGSGSSTRRTGPSGRSEGGGGRSKALIAGGALLGVLGIAYGAGLLLDHADVPNGTTVLGVDIGGMSRAAAAQKLDNALGERTQAMTVTINGEQHQLQPDKAGLGVKSEATVREAAGRDYNPVTVIGSLFGGSHEADPVYAVDKEKLTAALKIVSGEASGALDGTIKFVPGRAVPVPGKPHEALDIGKAVPAVADAFREQAATGKSDPVALPSSMRKPAVSNAEIQRKMRAFAQPAMSGLVTVKAGSAVIQFGPDKSLPKILSMRVVGGKLVEHYNLRAVKQLYGSTFDGILIRRGNGSKTPVTPQDVVNAMGPALLKTDPAQRVGIIPLNGN